MEAKDHFSRIKNYLTCRKRRHIFLARSTIGRIVRVGSRFIAAAAAAAFRYPLSWQLLGAGRTRDSNACLLLT